MIKYFLINDKEKIMKKQKKEVIDPEELKKIYEELENHESPYFQEYLAKMDAEVEAAKQAFARFPTKRRMIKLLRVMAERGALFL